MDNSIKDIIRNEFKLLLPENKEGLDDTPIGELGVDSLDFFEFILHLDDAYEIKLHNIQLDNKLTLNAIIATLAL